MGRGKNKRSRQKNGTSSEVLKMQGEKEQVEQRRGEGYKDIIKENADFELYYKRQAIVPVEEWEKFMTTLREGLPAAFRITGYRGQAKALLNIIKGRYFEDLLKVRIDGEEICRPLCLPWYPNDLAWQLKLSRVIIRKSEELEQLHNFLISETETGNISRQETVSMIPPLLLDVKPHHKILDMCAAPGSKTAQVIELLHKDEGKIPDGVVVANDVDNKRCYMLVHQAKRLNSPCFIITNHDAINMPDLQITKDGQYTTLKYDRILCDVPCSLQLRIAKRGLELLAPGGRMVYSTCSLNPMEDEAVIASLLLQAEGAAELMDVSSSLPGLKTTPGMSHWKVMNRNLELFDSFEDVPCKYKTQIRPHMFPLSHDVMEKLHLERCFRILPHHQDTGGFFIAVIQKIKSNVPWESQACDDIAGEKPQISQRSPPRKKRKVWGYKEDPFIFFEEEDDIWPSIRDFYQLADFTFTQLLSRCREGRRRNLYFVSDAAKDIVQANSSRVKIINTGVRMFCRSDNKDAKCPFRLTQEGIPTIMPFMKGRKLQIQLHDLVLLLSNEFPVKENFSEELQLQMSAIDSGCVVVIYTGNQSGEEFKVELCGWKGKNSLRCYVPKNERAHYLRICGVDVSEYEKRNKKYKAKASDSEKESERDKNENSSNAEDFNNEKLVEKENNKSPTTDEKQES